LCIFITSNCAFKPLLIGFYMTPIVDIKYINIRHTFARQLLIGLFRSNGDVRGPDQKLFVEGIQSTK